MTATPLFTVDDVEFLEIDVPHPKVAYKVRVDGREVYTAVTVMPGMTQDQILSELVETAKFLRKRMT